MGVKHLWSIIQPVGKKEPLESLRGKTLCVDLSAWICQAETLPLKHTIAKPYLRNTIFRVLCLKRLGTRLIFLTEGKPPELKWNLVLAKVAARTEHGKKGSRFYGSRPTRKEKCNGDENNVGTGAKVDTGKPKKVGRSIFQRKINECAQLLGYLGFPVIKSEGEAEACCALLDRMKVADGCVTQDGDTFLYGANVVYRNLGISNKTEVLLLEASSKDGLFLDCIKMHISLQDPHVYRYSMEDVQAVIGIDREQMIALSLLFGCDYCDGVQGIGIKSALKLLSELRGADVLQMFRDWKKGRKLPNPSSSIEKQIYKKLMQEDEFPNEEVISEFLEPKDDLESIIGQIGWNYPDLVNIQRFCFKHMEWPEEYTLSKVLGVATNEHLNRISRGIPVNSPFTPHRLVKTRTLHGVPLCEVEWKMEFNVKIPGSWDGYPESFFTLESQQEVLQCLPKLAEACEKLKLSKSSTGKKNCREVLKEIPKTEATKDDDDTASQTNSSERCHKRNAYDTTENAKEMHRSEDRRDGKFSCNTELCLNTQIKVNVNENFDGINAADLNKENAEDQYDIDEVVKSFIGIDLNSIFGDHAASMATEGSTDAGSSDHSDMENLHRSSGDYRTLPLRERLKRKVLTNKEERRTRVEVNRRYDVEKSEFTAVRDAKLLMKADNASEATAISTANTAPVRDENSLEINSVLRSKLGNEKTRLRVTEMFGWRGKSRDSGSAAKFEIGCEDKYLEDESGQEKERNGKRTNNSAESKPFRATDDMDNKDYTTSNAHKTVNSQESCRKSVPEVIDLTSPSPYNKVSPIMPKGNTQSNNKETNISDDSLAHLLNDSLFDSPQFFEEIDYVEGQEKTLNIKESVADPRQEIGIRKNSTHDTRVSITKRSQQRVEDDTEFNWASLPLMERLKRRLQKD